MRIRGTTWVVTGAGSGIGRELVLELTGSGARVAAVDRDASGLEKLAADATYAGLSTHVVDVTDRAAVEALPDEVVAEHGRVDGLVNNAGIIQPFVDLADLDDATIEHVLDVNLRAPLHLVRTFLPHLLGGPAGHVVNVSSMGGFFPFPGQTVYGASKAALKLLSEGLYLELLDTPVRVTVVMPGAVETGIAENSGVSMPEPADRSRMRAMPAREAAAAILAAVEADRLHVYVGRDAKAMNIAVKVAFGPSIRFVRRRMLEQLPSLSGGASRSPGRRRRGHPRSGHPAAPPAP
ncbi:SDR family NAD(P)-dependent oxidoreductase [Nocardioides coralli]|uniref:SDR family NAD(P)-dependent oxidoreductase n=1 Tax=Nocardioides coralli TaxID=2872154 RepID=UPI001CA3F516|nr:SDR family oxidoreductase [Nocardioides coralli]QZY28433.1 SDR family oxidoreductase [Nocardioides coralli]